MLAFYLSMLETQADTDKFEQLYNRYKYLMLNKAYEILHNRQLAEDAVQEAFLRVLKNLDKVCDVEDKHTKSFLMVIVKNVSVTMYNKEKRISVISDDEIVRIPHNESLQETTERKLDSIYIAKMIKTLPEKYSQALMLRYVHGLSDKEIGSVLNISASNAQKRAERGKKMLADLLRRGEENA